MSELIDIIIPVFNREKTLPYAIQSILNQTYENWRLILVDDSSTDGSPKIIEAFEERDARIVSKINTEHPRSPAGSRASGLMMSKAKYIAFLDSDDEWEPEHLSTSIKLLEKHDLDFVSCDLYRHDNGKIISQSKLHNEVRLEENFPVAKKGDVYFPLDGFLLSAVKKRLSLSFHCSVYKRTVFDKLKIPLIRIGEDYIFTLRALCENLAFALLDKKHVKYRVHTDNISNVNKRKSRRSECVAFTKEAELYGTLIPLMVDKLPPEALKACKQKASTYYRYAAGATNSKRARKIFLYASLKMQPANIKSYINLLFSN